MMVNNRYEQVNPEVEERHGDLDSSHESRHEAFSRKKLICIAILVMMGGTSFIIGTGLAAHYLYQRSNLPSLPDTKLGLKSAEINIDETSELTEIDQPASLETSKKPGIFAVVGDFVTRVIPNVFRSENNIQCNDKEFKVLLEKKDFAVYNNKNPKPSENSWKKRPSSITCKDLKHFSKLYDDLKGGPKGLKVASCVLPPSSARLLSEYRCSDATACSTHPRFLKLGGSC